MVAVSRSAVTKMTPNVKGRNMVNCNAKHIAYPLNLCLVFFNAVMTETIT